ncbi:peptidoglycan-binding protein LysM [Flavobacteriaceae bacterium]|nr:peptidoglycan-binding protein LysM [Flavobacteriaceae bacterium]MDB2631856.1 peptidoglycan-binding protein LysM [Flavobacteriaceae bacterium]
MKTKKNTLSISCTVISCVIFLATTSSPDNEIDTLESSTAINFDYNLSEVFSVEDKVDFKVENYIYLDRSYVGFKEAIAFKESQGKYKVVNALGYLGKYQFGVSTLKLIGIYSPTDFLNNPKLQEKAFLANAKRNKWVLRRDIKRFVGHKINGTLVTESGILAAAHLAGPGNVKRYLRSYGTVGFTDAFGTDIASYMRRFSSYDTSFIVPNKRPKAKLL